MSLREATNPLKPYVLETLMELRETLIAVDQVMTTTKPDKLPEIYRMRENILTAIDACVDDIALFLTKPTPTSYTTGLTTDCQSIGVASYPPPATPTKLPDCL